MKRFYEIIMTNSKVKRFVTDNRENLKRIVVLSALIVVLLIAFAVKNAAQTPVITSEEADASTDITTGTIFVDIGGAVKNPMLAELPEGSRVEDAIEEAGGLKNDADLSSINRAEFLNDGDKIYIPETASSGDSSDTGDSGSGVSVSSSSGKSANGKININTADSATLQEISGIGPVTAQKIIDYRSDNGRFKTIEDIKNVSGIGDKTFENLKDYITT